MDNGIDYEKKVELFCSLEKFCEGDYLLTEELTLSTVGQYIDKNLVLVQYNNIENDYINVTFNGRVLEGEVYVVGLDILSSRDKNLRKILTKFKDFCNGNRNIIRKFIERAYIKKCIRVDGGFKALLKPNSDQKYYMYHLINLNGNLVFISNCLGVITNRRRNRNIRVYKNARINFYEPIFSFQNRKGQEVCLLLQGQLHRCKEELSTRLYEELLKGCYQIKWKNMLFDLFFHIDNLNSRYYGNYENNNHFYRNIPEGGFNILILSFLINDINQELVKLDIIISHLPNFNYNEINFLIRELSKIVVSLDY